MSERKKTATKPRAKARAAPSSDRLRVRLYNVRFGDAILVSIFEAGEARHILIDVGNVTGTGGDTDVFGPVIADVVAELKDKPLDLYVMTHEHMDHVKGLLYVNDKRDIDVKGRLKVKQAWLTVSSEPTYYATHPDAKKKKLETEEATRAIGRFLFARLLAEQPPARSGARTLYDRVSLLGMRAERVTRDVKATPAARKAAAAELRVAAMLLNNDFQSTGKCVDFLRALAKPDDTYYVHREFALPRLPNLLSAKVKIWGPEEDTSVYYGRLRPLTLGLAEGGGADTLPSLPELSPPSGVDAGAFFDLVEARRHGYGENLLTIDKAANNTSIVFCLEWKGWRLLFPGDAEEKSWAIMDRCGLLNDPVDFLKIGHHGSHNGTPSVKLLDKILPIDGKPRFAAVCTCAGVYGDTPETAVPNQTTLSELKRRCTVESVQDLKKGGRLDVIFPADRSAKVMIRRDSD